MSSSSSSSLTIIEEIEEEEEEEGEDDETEEEEVIDDDILVEDVVDKAADRFLIGTGSGSKRRKAKPPKESSSASSTTAPVYFDDCPEFKRPEPADTDMTLLQIARIPGYPHKTAAVAEIDSKVAEFWMIIWIMKTYMEAQGDKPPELDLSFEEDITGESGGKV